MITPEPIYPYEVGLKYSQCKTKAEKIHELEKEPELNTYIVHLHNDLIDTLSALIPGVVLTILAFSAILIYALRTLYFNLAFSLVFVILFSNSFICLSIILLFVLILSTIRPMFIR